MLDLTVKFELGAGVVKVVEAIMSISRLGNRARLGGGGEHGGRGCWTGESFEVVTFEGMVVKELEESVEWWKGSRRSLKWLQRTKPDFVFVCLALEDISSGDG